MLGRMRSRVEETEDGRSQAGGSERSDIPPPILLPPAVLHINNSCPDQRSLSRIDSRMSCSISPRTQLPIPSTQPCLTDCIPHRPLGADPYLPRGLIESFLRVFKHFALKIPRGKVRVFFKKTLGVKIKKSPGGKLKKNPGGKF